MSFSRSEEFQVKYPGRSRRSLEIGTSSYSTFRDSIKAFQRRVNFGQLPSPWFSKQVGLRQMCVSTRSCALRFKRHQHLSQSEVGQRCQTDSQHLLAVPEFSPPENSVICRDVDGIPLRTLQSVSERYSRKFPMHTLRVSFAVQENKHPPVVPMSNQCPISPFEERQSSRQRAFSFRRRLFVVWVHI